jgi:hypothetical protein
MMHLICHHSHSLSVSLKSDIVSVGYLVTVIYPGITHTVKLMSISKVLWLKTWGPNPHTPLTEGCGVCQVDCIWAFFCSFRNM